MAEATTPCTAAQTASCPRLASCATAWTCEPDGDIGQAVRWGLLLSLPLWALGYCLVLVALRGCP